MRKCITTDEIHWRPGTFLKYTINLKVFVHFRKLSQLLFFLLILNVHLIRVGSKQLTSKQLGRAFTLPSP